MKVIIVEDEALIAKDLQKNIHSLYPTWEIVAILDSIQKSIAWLQTNEPPALAFMDIQLADGVSFEIFEHIDVQFPVIFTTAYDQYALKAFQVNGIGYLLKPIDSAELAKAIDKFQKTDLQTQLKSLLQDLKPTLPTAYKERFLATYKGNLVPVSAQDIACVEKDELIFLHTYEGKKYISDCQTLDEVEQLLNPLHFYRANRQFIINIRAIETLKPTYKGISVKLCLPTLSEIEVSREKVASIKQWLNQ